ncbi:MAG: hypothetical protein DRG25_03060 [Deltaproteobacteria bacterium]|nr:MAG: hypothetical protein DRG25_03060 [Deltaproteobacteria bacterium]
MLGIVGLIILVAVFLFYLLFFSSLIFDPKGSLSPYIITSDSPPINSFRRVPAVSVLVPARNEEQNIGNCLQALLEQDYSNLEIIVIDDQSTDKTAEIVKRFQKKNEAIKLISGKKLPPGWIGKNHALFQGVQEAGGEYLLFLDADVVLTSRHCISQIVKYAMEHETDLLTLVPELECKTFWEKVVLPILGFFIINRFTLKNINNPSSKITSVVGPFLFFKRQTYEEIGGHEGIKGEIVEDLVLAQTIKKKGYRLSYMLGMELFSLREYANFQEIWEGFSKNFFAGMNQNVMMAVACIFLMLSVLVLPPLLVLLSLGYLLFFGWDKFAILYLILGIIPYFITIVVRRILKIYAKLDNTYAFLQPLGALVLISILINSIIKVSFCKGVSWKGRVYLNG